MKSARGIRRRTRERLGRLESRLQAEAVKRARMRHGERLDQSKHLLAEARDDLHRTAEEIVQLQERINRRADQTDALRNGLRSVDAATNRVEHLQLLLREIEDRRAALERERRRAASDLGVEMVGCAANALPVALSRRIRSGSLAGAIALLTLLLFHRMAPGRGDRRSFPRPDHPAL